MEEKVNPEQIAEKLGIESEKIDFTIHEEELQKVSGAGPVSGEDGSVDGGNTTGSTGPCDKIGLPWTNCSNPGF